MISLECDLGRGILTIKRTGQCSSTVQVRLLRYWEARNARLSGELMGVDMLLLDSQSVKKFCNESLPKNRRPLDTTACENPPVNRCRLSSGRTVGSDKFIFKYTTKSRKGDG
ncbi:unnamed protein product [Brassica oleracea var. botrytis]|uniref:Uncharacterized protein n=2 Tax=Brassica oleracea TaxID=3712 RepID=A0A0D3D4V0_BRAOL|nr:unnamed protein product [Brassica oleracea]